MIFDHKICSISSHYEINYCFLSSREAEKKAKYLVTAVVCQWALLQSTFVSFVDDELLDFFSWTVIFFQAKINRNFEVKKIVSVRRTIFVRKRKLFLRKIWRNFRRLTKTVDENVMGILNAKHHRCRENRRIKTFNNSQMNRRRRAITPVTSNPERVMNRRIWHIREHFFFEFSSEIEKEWKIIVLWSMNSDEKAPTWLGNDAFVGMMSSSVTISAVCIWLARQERSISINVERRTNEVLDRS